MQSRSQFRNQWRLGLKKPLLDTITFLSMQRYSVGAVWHGLTVKSVQEMSELIANYKLPLLNKQWCQHSSRHRQYFKIYFIIFFLKQLGSKSKATCLPDTHQRSFRHHWRRRWVRVRTNPGHPSLGRGWALQSPFPPNTPLLVGCLALSRLYLQRWKSKHRFSGEVLPRGVWRVLHFSTEREKVMNKQVYANEVHETKAQKPFIAKHAGHTKTVQNWFSRASCTSYWKLLK